MSKVSITRSKLDDLASAISVKSGASLPLTLAQMQTAVENMSGATLTTKSITENGMYNASSDNADGYSSVTVNVPTPTPRSSSDLTVSGATVTAPAGYYSVAASKTVASGTEGTPTATKGTVSNHSVSVTPSVTNTAGYIAGGTHTGTAVTVSASELVSGTYAVNSSGTKDVTNYASASVPAGTVTAPSTISGTSATVSTGTNTLTLTKSVSVTPNVTTAGYVSAGTAGNASVSLTASVTTQAAQTIYPSTSDQTIASGRYLTGTQTIKAVTTSNLTAANIANGVTVTVGDSADPERIASVTGMLSFVTYRTGTSAPSSSLGNNGDIYLQTVS